MQLYKVFSLCCLALAISFSALAQDEPLKIDKNGNLIITPEMAERAKRRMERLSAPSFIKLKLELESNCQDEEARKTSDCYKAHSKIQMKLFMMNTSAESIYFSDNQHDPYEMTQLQLFRDGELVPYRKDVAERIAHPPPFASFMRVQLEPGKTEMVNIISLDSWYKPLEPGHYLLEIKRRFVPDGGWTDIASTTFEVEPE